MRGVRICTAMYSASGERRYEHAVLVIVGLLLPPWSWGPAIVTMSVLARSLLPHKRNL